MSLVTLKWILFVAAVLVLLAVDVGLFHRKPRALSRKEALVWVAVWVSLAMAYCLLVLFWKGQKTALEFLTGYIIEGSLSVDNIFVFILIFSYFKVPQELQHRVLFWGVLGALIMRGLMIGAGVALITSFAWIIYVFGVFLIFTGIRMGTQTEHGVDPEANAIVKLFRRFVPVTPSYEGQSFFVRRNGRTLATPLLVVLVVIEFTDVVFAVDSVPAVLAITLDPFVVFTSNVFAVLGLRSLYFALGGMMDRFHHLRYGLAIVLVFVGVKMLLGHTAWSIPTGVSLLIVIGVLAAAVVLSLLLPKSAEIAQEIGPSDRLGPYDMLFYDGACGLCHRAVRFALARDRSGERFRFAPLGGEAFGRAIPEAERALLPDSLVLVTADGTVHTRSRAVVHMLGRVGGMWAACATLLRIVPPPLRDLAYDSVARIRHRLFARPADTCPIVPPELRSRFL